MERKRFYAHHRDTMNSEARIQSRENTLTTLAAMYPVAFAMVAASNSRAGQAIRRWKSSDLEPSSIIPNTQSPFPESLFLLVNPR